MLVDELMNENLFTLIRSRISDPLRVFLHDPSNGTVSYGDLLDLSGQYANTLVDLGVEPGDRVAVQVEKSPAALFLYLGCLRAGAVYLPLNTGYTGPELAYFLSRCRADCVYLFAGQTHGGSGDCRESRCGAG